MEYQRYESRQTAGSGVLGADRRGSLSRSVRTKKTWRKRTVQYAAYLGLFSSPAARELGRRDVTREAWIN